jgi:hypothetical protein
MTRSPEPIDGDSDGDRNANAYQVVYLVKRSAYEFVLAVPEAQTPSHRERPAVFQMHFRNQPPGQGFMLDLQGLEDFYESLSRLMDYVRIEQQKHQEEH